MRVLGLISGWDGGGFDIAMRNVRVSSVLTGTTSEYDENGRQDKLAAVSRRTRIEFDGLVDGGNVPEAGATFTFRGRKYLITSAVLTAEKGRFQRYIIKAERSDEAEVSGLTS